MIGDTRVVICDDNQNLRSFSLDLFISRNDHFFVIGTV